MRIRMFSTRIVGILVLVIALVFSILCESYALAPRTRLKTKPASPAFATEQERRDFLNQFVYELKLRLAMVRQEFSYLEPKELERFLKVYAERAAIKMVSAQIMPSLMHGRALPSLEEFRHIARWINVTFRTEFAEQFGKLLYMDFLGDYMAILAHEILTRYQPKDLSKLPPSQKQMASWALLYNMGHVCFHNAVYERNWPAEGYPEKRSRRVDAHDARRVRDFIQQAELSASLLDLTRAAFGNLPAVERFWNYPSDFKPLFYRGEQSYINDLEFKPLAIFHDIGCGILPNDPFEQPDKSMEAVLERAAREISPAIATVIAEPLDDGKIWFEGLFRLYALPLANANHQYVAFIKEKTGAKVGGKTPKDTPFDEFVRRCAGMAVEPWPITDPPYNRIHEHFLFYGSEKRAGYPLLSSLTETFPVILPDWIYKKLEEAIGQSFRWWEGYEMYPKQPYTKIPPVVWSADEIKALGQAFADWPGSPAFDLALLLVWHYSELFDVHATIQQGPRGTLDVHVQLDPLFDVRGEIYSTDRVERNRQYYSRIRKLLKNPTAMKETVMRKPGETYGGLPTEAASALDSAL